MERKNDLEKFMNLRHIKRLVLEQTEEVRVVSKKDKVVSKIEFIKVTNLREYLLDNGQLKSISIGVGNCASIEDGDNVYYLQLKKE